MRLALSLLAAAGIAACATKPIPEPSAPTHVEDPSPPLLTPTSRGETGASVAIAVSSPSSEAIALVREVLSAIIEGDRARLERALAPKLVRATPSIGKATRSRAAVMAIALNQSRRKNIPEGISLERLIDLDELRAIPLEALSPVDLHEDLEAEDVLVRVPLTPEGSAAFRSILPGWSELGNVIVGSRAPRVVKGL